MIITKRLHRLISFFLSLTLVFQTFSPAIIYAQEATQSAEVPTETVTHSPTETPAVTPTPTESITPELTPTPEVTIEPTSAPVEEPTPVPTPEPTSRSNLEVSLWSEISGDTVTTNENVGEGIDYRFRDTNLIVHFTKVTKPGKLTIREIKLTPEQIAVSGALSDTAYDITSEMENGSFLYDLTLPLPQDNQNAKVEFASDQNSLDQSVAIETNVTKNPDTIEIKGLDHFTIFFVSSGIDQATNGNMCGEDLNCEFDVASTAAILVVDENYLSIADHLNVTDPFWPNSEEDAEIGDNYVQFNFEPITGNTSVSHLKLVFRTNGIDTSDPDGQPYGAKLIFSDSDFSEATFREVSVTPATGVDDQSFEINLKQFETPLNLANLKVRFLLYGTSLEGPLTSSFNQVIVEVPPTAPALISPADNSVVRGAVLTNSWTPVSDVTKYIYESYHDGAATSLRWHQEINAPTTSKTATNVANATFWWRVKAVDADGIESDWSPLWKVTIDNTAPTADLIFPTPGPSSTSFQVLFSELVDSGEATDPANYFLDNWPGAGGSGDLVGHANITYDPDSRLATVAFTTPGWRISPEQNWGVKNIHDLAGNQLADTWEYSTPMVAPTAPGTPLTPTPTNSLIQLWGWTAATDPGGVNASGIKGYWYSVTGPTPISWIFLSGNVLSATTSLGEGVSELSVKAEDNAGNQGDVSTGGVTVDRTPPNAPTPLTLADGVAIKGVAFTQTWTNESVSGAVLYQYQSCFNNPDLSPCSQKYIGTFSGTSKFVAAGQPNSHFWWHVKAKDAAGNWSLYGPAYEMTIDNSSPSTALDPYPNKPTNDNTPTYTGTSIDNYLAGINLVEYKIVNNETSATVTDWTPANSADGSFDSLVEEFNFTAVPLPDGDYTFYARATDRAGNIESTASDTLIIDTVFPTAEVGYSTTSPTKDDVVATLINSSEPITITSEGGSSHTFTENDSFLFEFTDAAGNPGSVLATVANIDKTAPTGNITTPVNGSYKNTKPTFRASASDANGIASVKFQYKPNALPDFLDLNTDTTPNASGLYQASWSGVTLVNGTTYDLQIIITDGVGNQNTVSGVSFLYDTLLPGILYNNPLGGETVWYNNSPLFDIDFLYDEGGAPLDKAQYRLDGGSYKNIFTADRTSDYTTDWGIASWATLAEGLHQLDIKLIDKAGNTNTDNYVEGISGLNLGKDLIAPVITVPENQTLEAESETGAPYVFSPAPSASDEYGTPAVTCNYASGETFPIGITSVTCGATDLAGNTGSATFDITVNDTTGPALSLPDNITAEATGADGATVTYEASANDLVDGPVEISCSPESGSTFSLGTTAVDCEATDSNDNTTSGSFEVTVEDDIKPTSIITSPDNNGSNSLIYSNSWDGSILGTAADNESGLVRVELSIQRTSDGKYFDGESWTDAGEDEPRVTAGGTENWSYALPSPAEDSYEITSHAVDNADNVEDSYKLTIVFDKTIPEVALTLDPATPDGGNNWYMTEPTITLTATDNTVTDHIEYQWDSTTGVWTVYVLPFKTIDQGSHTLYYRAFDKAGNVSGTGIKNIKYDKEDLTNGALNVSVSPNPTSGTTAKVKWEAASDNVGIEKYEVNWSLDGTSTSYTDTVGNEVREHEINKLDQEGKWNVTVTAFDAAGNRKSGSTELTVDRGAPAAPTLTLGGTGVGTATLTWNKVADAEDYIIWYGNVSGTYLFGARTGDVDNFTVRGLGGGDYYFVIQSVDNAGNRSGNSNEVSTLALAGTPGVEPGTPAEGFTPEVRGESTSETPTPTATPTAAVLGTEKNSNFPWWLILLLIATGGYASWRFLRRP